MNSCCPKAPPSSVQEEIEKLEEFLEALEMRIRAASYKREELLLKAKRFNAEGNKEMALAHMRMRQEKGAAHARLVHVFENVSRIRDSLDETSTLSDVAQQMGAANGLLESLLTRTRIEDLDTLMDSLDENVWRARELGDALARTEMGFDEEEALRELEERATPALQVPAKEPPQKRALPSRAEARSASALDGKKALPLETEARSASVSKEVNSSSVRVPLLESL